MNNWLFLVSVFFCFVQILAAQDTVNVSIENLQNSAKGISLELPLFYWIIVAIGLLSGFILGRSHVFLKSKREISDILAEKTKREKLGYSFTKEVFDLNEKYNNINKENMGKGYERIIDNLRIENDDLTKKLEDAKREISHLKQRIRDLEEKVNLHDPEYLRSEPKNESYPIDSSTGLSETRGVPIDQLSPINQGSKPIERKFTSFIFFSMPESDGSFKLSNGEPSNDGRKNFRIEYDKLSKEGDLFFISSERDQKAINSLESFLKPVCDIENISSATTASRISFIEKGKVLLVNDSWVIDPGLAPYKSDSFILNFKSTLKSL